MKGRRGWNCRSSEFARKTFNPIRSIVDTMQLMPNPDKPVISLSIGDPTIFGNLKPEQVIIDAVVESVQSMEYNGYAPCNGYQGTREAIARHYNLPEAPLEAKDVIVCSGCSHALDLCISVLANRGQNILVPRPGFSIYTTLAKGMGINTKLYNLLPERDWEVDLAHLESQIDANTAAIVVNNPSNPCGSVYSAHHLRQIIDIAARNYVPIIADEIYDDFVFTGCTFYPMASLSTEVPILTCGGLTKKYVVPGWRVGWILIHDRQNIFDDQIRDGLQAVSQRIIGSNTIVQGAISAILTKTPPEFFASTIAVVQLNAEIAYTKLSKVPGLKPVMPAGAMYMMVGVEMDRFPNCQDDLQFVESMMAEQSVFCLPGRCFEYPDYIRLVLTVPVEQLEEACERLAEYCETHYVYEKEQSNDDEPAPLLSIANGKIANGHTRHCLKKRAAPNIS